MGTYARSMLPRVWSCLTIFIVAALGIFVSSIISTLGERCVVQALVPFVREVTHGFSPSSSTKSSNRFGAFMTSSGYE